MKKILTICTFAFALLISSQGFAQAVEANNTTVAGKNIKSDVMKIATNLGLNDAQTDAFTNAYMKRDKVLKAEKANITSESINKVNQKFLASLKGILTEDQLSKLKTLNSEK